MRPADTHPDLPKFKWRQDSPVIIQLETGEHVTAFWARVSFNGDVFGESFPPKWYIKQAYHPLDGTTVKKILGWKYLNE